MLSVKGDDDEDSGTGVVDPSLLGGHIAAHTVTEQSRTARTYRGYCTPVYGTG